MSIYGYVRVSTLEQNKERQITNILKKYPEAIIMSDEYTGKTMNRPAWKKLYPRLKKGDVVVFDEVSRMSRNAEEGFEVYQELYERGVELIFLKEPHISTTSYSEALRGSVSVDVKSGDKDTDDLISGIMAALNKFMLAKVQGDIRSAFGRSQAETDLRSARQKEGIRERKARNKEAIKKYGSVEEARKHPEDYKEWERKKGDKLHIKKTEPIKALIREYSRDFNGHNTDAELLGILSTKTIKVPSRKRSGKVEEREISAKLSRNTLYKYKRELREEQD